ncbi:MAG: nuclear transport factor 2 family protein [Novosphingobium sp.]|nr:nuclear transport factor 2 family protein [Novosphingobium sp.]
MPTPADPADELAIRNLIARMAHIADRGAVEDYAPMMTPDARWILPTGDETVGPEEMMAGVRARRAGGTAGPGSGTRHLITTVTVEVDGDTARGWSYWLYVTTGSDPKILMNGLYTDTFRRTGGGWRFSGRISTLE